MKKTATWAAAMAVLGWAGSLWAHHSLGNFDTALPLWVKGTVVRFERANPHSVIFLDQKLEDGQIHRWAVDGPAPVQLNRRGIGPDFLKVGDIVEVCGFATKTGVPSERVRPRADDTGPDSSAPSMSGQIMNGHVLVVPDGRRWFWADYGQLQKCVGLGEQDSLIR
jgi:hypothetical protein